MSVKIIEDQYTHPCDVNVMLVDAFFDVLPSVTVVFLKEKMWTLSLA